MKLVKRTINGIDLAVDIESASDFFVSKKANVSFDPIITKTTEVLKVLSNGMEYSPLHLKIEITSLCNLSCEFCYIHNHTSYNNIQLNLIKPYFDYLIEKGLFLTVLTGGECTLNPEFMDIYMYLKSRGVFVELYTNCVALNDDILKMLTQYKPYRVEVSLYNSDFNSSVYQNVQRLIDGGIKVVAKCTVNTVTYPFFAEIRSWCETHKVPFYFSTDVYDALDGTDLRKFELSNQEKRNLYSSEIIDIMNMKKSSGVKRCFACNSGSFSISIDSNYQLRPCIRYPWSLPLLEHSPQAAFSLIREQVIKEKGKIIYNCSECKAKNICKMCIVRAVKNEVDGTYYAPEKYCKEMQELYDCITK